MDYNKKLQELISEAQKDGYDFIDGDSAKFKRKEEWLYVMEVFIFSKTCYEDSGNYHIFKDIYEIPQNIFLRMKDSSSRLWRKEEKGLHGEIFQLFVDRILREISDFSIYDFYWYGDERTTSFHHIQYERYSDCDDCYEVHFTKNGEESTYPDGYISFYKMKRDDYIAEKEKSVNMILEKFMRPNV